MRVPTAPAAAAAGLVVGAAVTVAVPWSTPAIGCGALAVAAVVLAVRRERRPFALAGTLYVLALPVVQAALTGVRPVETPAVAMVGFGLASLAVLAVRRVLVAGATQAGSAVVDEADSEAVSRAVGAAAGTASMLWIVLNAKRKAAEFGGVTGVAAVAALLDLLGVRVWIPVVLQRGLDATLVTFVGSVVVGFHLLESLYAAWRVAGRAARSSAGAASTAADRTTAAGSTVTEAAGGLRDRVDGDAADDDSPGDGG